MYKDRPISFIKEEARYEGRDVEIGTPLLANQFDNEKSETQTLLVNNVGLNNKLMRTTY